MVLVAEVVAAVVPAEVGKRREEKAMKSFLIGLLVVAVVVLGIAVASYNRIVTLHETITAKWAQVENQLQRRNDLIPNLVKTVKGYASHEKSIFIQVTEARSKWANAKTVDQKIEAASEVDRAMARLLLVVENYPNLKANETFLKLMDELSGTENRIAVERMRYNETVKDYNVAIRRFPGNIIAGLYNYQRATEYFKAEEAAKAVPKVEF